MKKQISPKIVSLIFSILVICFAVGFYAFAVWQEPTLPQPGGNVPPPLNTSSQAQVKIGGLMLNTHGYPNGLIVDQGNVGIGTVAPSEKLDVSGQIHATGDICTDAGGGVCLSTAAAGGFGVWNDIDKDGNPDTVTVNTVYQAATDGFVVAYNTYQKAVSIRTGPTSPGIVRQWTDGHEHASSGSVMCPVRKNHFWQVQQYARGSGVTRVFWIPFGN